MNIAILSYDKGDERVRPPQIDLNSTLTDQDKSKLKEFFIGKMDHEDWTNGEGRYTKYENTLIPELFSDDKEILKELFRKKIGYEGFSWSGERVGFGFVNPGSGYTSYEKTLIREWFTQDEVKSLNKSFRKKLYLLHVPWIVIPVFILLIILYILYSTGPFFRYCVLIIIYLIIWNSFLKPYVIGFWFKVGGDRFVVDQYETLPELYNLVEQTQSRVQTWIIDCFLLPIFLLGGILFIVWILTL